MTDVDVLRPGGSRHGHRTRGAAGAAAQAVDRPAGRSRGASSSLAIVAFVAVGAGEDRRARARTRRPPTRSCAGSGSSCGTARPAELREALIEHLKLTIIPVGLGLRRSPRCCRRSPSASAGPSRPSPRSPGSSTRSRAWPSSAPSGRATRHFTAAVIALTSYTLLILIRNIVAGIDARAARGDRRGRRPRDVASDGSSVGRAPARPAGDHRRAPGGHGDDHRARRHHRRSSSSVASARSCSTATRTSSTRQIAVGSVASIAARDRLRPRPQPARDRAHAVAAPEAAPVIASLLAQSGDPDQRDRVVPGRRRPRALGPDLRAAAHHAPALAHRARDRGRRRGAARRRARPLPQGRGGGGRRDQRRSGRPHGRHPRHPRARLHRGRPGLQLGPDRARAGAARAAPAVHEHLRRGPRRRSRRRERGPGDGVRRARADAPGRAAARPCPSSSRACASRRCR